MTINRNTGVRETAYGQSRKRLLCWLQEHNSHGLSYEPIFLEEDDEPEVGEWIRAPWLDEPKR